LAGEIIKKFAAADAFFAAGIRIELLQSVHRLRVTQNVFFVNE
jgi:hypothetical protein